MAKPRAKTQLGQKKDGEVLMNYIKTRNYRERKKMEVRAQEKRDASMLAYSKKRKDKIKGYQMSIKNSFAVIKKKEGEIKKLNTEILKEKDKIVEAKSKIAKESKSLNLIQKGK